MLSVFHESNREAVCCQLKLPWEKTRKAEALRVWRVNTRREHDDVVTEIKFHFRQREIGKGYGLFVDDAVIAVVTGEQGSGVGIHFQRPDLELFRLHRFDVCLGDNDAIE